MGEGDAVDTGISIYKKCSLYAKHCNLINTQQLFPFAIRNSEILNKLGKWSPPQRLLFRVKRKKDEAVNKIRVWLGIPNSNS